MAGHHQMQWENCARYWQLAAAAILTQALQRTSQPTASCSRHPAKGCIWLQLCEPRPPAGALELALIAVGA
jgi:hypothetical protein